MSDINYRRDGKLHHDGAMYKKRSSGFNKKNEHRFRRRLLKIEVPENEDDAEDMDLPKIVNPYNWIRQKFTHRAPSTSSSEYASQCSRDEFYGLKSRSGVIRKHVRDNRIEWLHNNRAEQPGSIPSNVKFYEIERTLFDPIDGKKHAVHDKKFIKYLMRDLENAVELHITTPNGVYSWVKNDPILCHKDYIISRIIWALNNTSVSSLHTYTEHSVNEYFVRKQLCLDADKWMSSLDFLEVVFENERR